MSMYKELSMELELIATSTEELNRFKEMTTQHFEGDMSVWSEMPDVLKQIIISWEDEHRAN